MKSDLQKQWDIYEKRIKAAIEWREEFYRKRNEKRKANKKLAPHYYSKPFLDYDNMGYIGSVDWSSEYNVSPEAGDYRHVFWDYSEDDYWRIVSIKKPHFQGKAIRKGKHGIPKN